MASEPVVTHCDKEAEVGEIGANIDSILETNRTIQQQQHEINASLTTILTELATIHELHKNLNRTNEEHEQRLSSMSKRITKLEKLAVFVYAFGVISLGTLGLLVRVWDLATQAEERNGGIYRPAALPMKDRTYVVPRQDNNSADK